jgi:Ca2+/Na+ antiporter
VLGEEIVVEGTVLAIADGEAHDVKTITASNLRKRALFFMDAHTSLFAVFLLSSHISRLQSAARMSTCVTFMLEF